MIVDDFRVRAAAIAAVPPQLSEYQRWLAALPRAAKGERDYLFSEPKLRFEPRKEDVAVAVPGLEVAGRGAEARLVCLQPRVDITVPGVSRSLAERLLAAMDGKRRLLEVRWEAGVEQAVLARFLRAAFGRVIMAPEAVRALEGALSGMEITRYPGPPYGVDRSYWANMIDLRQWFEQHRDAFADTAAFAQLLRELHVIALMGRSLQSFYRPASPVADRLVAPGAWFLDEPRLQPGTDTTLFLDGPRVNVSFMGRKGYYEALFASLEDTAALADERQLVEGGLDWGQVTVARSEKDEAPGPWFCPPRPITEGHLAWLGETLAGGMAAAARGQADEAIGAAAGFHHGFVRLHPFHCANQSLAMNLVGAVLARSHGAGIPHLILDHLALRLARAPYERVFRRAVAAFLLTEENPGRRLATLQERTQRSFAVIKQVSAARSADERRAAIDTDPDGVRWALLVD